MSMDISQPGAATVIPFSQVASDSQVSSKSSDDWATKLISRRHPEYNSRIDSWRFFASTYAGGRQWFDENVHKYIREGEMEFRERQDRAYRFNHTKEVVDLLNKYLFKQNIQRSEDAPKSVLEFWERTTQSGTGMDEFAKQISKRCSIYGRIGIVVDRKRGASGAMTVKEVKEAKINTYAYIVNPEDMLDYSFDDEGALNWILIREYYRNDENPFDVDDVTVHARFRLWTRNDWYLISEKKRDNSVSYELVDQGEHKLGMVPVILADNLLTDEQYGAPSLINDIAYLDKAVANYLSNLDAIIQDQTFSQLVMPAQNVTSGSDEAEMLYEMGTKRIFLYDAAGSNHSPEYISPDPSQAHLILDVITRIIKEIYNSVGLASERTNKDNAVSMDNASGVAKAYDFERVNALLSAKADSLEVVENKIAHLVAKWNGDDKADLKTLVSYPDNFDTRGLYDEFDIAARLMLVEAPNKIRQEQMRLVVDKLFPLMKRELRKKIDAEIDDWPQTDLMQVVTRTASNNLAEPTNTMYKTGGKGDATKKADGSAVDNKRPAATSRQGEVTKNTK